MRWNQSHVAWRTLLDAKSVDDGVLQIGFNNSTGDPFLFGLTVEQVSTNISEEKAAIPNDYKLEQNFPNPFNPVTTIKYALPIRAFVRLNIYDIRGALIYKILQDQKEAGTHEIRLNLDLASGIYLYELQVLDGTLQYRAQKKMIVLQ